MTDPRLVVGNTEVYQVSEQTRWVFGTRHAPAPGDWVLRSPSLRVGVAGLGGHRRLSRPGTVFQVLWLDRPEREELRSIEPFLVVEGREVALITDGFETLLARAEPTLRMNAHALSTTGTTLRIQRDWSLEPGRNALHVRTRVENLSGPTARRVAVGARLGWGGAPPFVPGMGTVTEACRGQAAWVGHGEESLAMGWARLEGTFALNFLGDTHSADRSVVSVEASSPPTDLEHGHALTDHTVLLASGSDLAAISRAAALLRRERIVETPVEVLGATPKTRPTVMVTDASGAVALISEPEDEVSTLPLPPGEYTAYAIAPGHAPADPVRFRTYTGTLPMRLEIPPGGHLRVEALDAETGRDLPVRVVVRGIPPTLDPMLGPFHAASGAGVVAVTPTGRARIPVPPGRYRVTVSHGPEWTISTTTTTVTPTLRGDVSVRLTHSVPMNDWTACDLHVHAESSFDSRVTIADRVASLVAEGIGFATPTEHNAVGDYTTGVAALPRGLTAPFNWVPGVEVTTDRNSPPWGHFNLYPYLPDPSAPEGNAPRYMNTTPREIFRTARANNPEVIIQVNHPRMQPNLGYFDTVGLDPRTNRATSPEYDPGYDAIEVFNGHFLGRIDLVEALLGDWFSLLGSGARYVATGSSDSHKIVFPWAGYPRTYVHAPPDAPPAELLRALRRGHAFVTSGPMLFLSAGEALPGDEVPLTGQELVPFRVRVMAAPWISVDSVELYRDGARVQTLPVRRADTPLRLDAEVPLAISPGSFVVAVARGGEELESVLPNAQARPFAFTNPIFFVQRREDGGGEGGEEETGQGDATRRDR